MKKTIKRIGAIALSCVTIFCATGCIKTEDSFIEDGDLGYYYIEEEDCYAVLDLTEE